MQILENSFISLQLCIRLSVPDFAVIVQGFSPRYHRKSQETPFSCDFDACAKEFAVSH